MFHSPPAHPSSGEAWGGRIMHSFIIMHYALIIMHYALQKKHRLSYERQCQREYCLGDNCETQMLQAGLIFTILLLNIHPTRYHNMRTIERIITFLHRFFPTDGLRARIRIVVHSFLYGGQIVFQ